MAHDDEWKHCPGLNQLSHRAVPWSAIMYVYVNMQINIYKLVDHPYIYIYIYISTTFSYIYIYRYMYIRVNFFAGPK